MFCTGERRGRLILMIDRERLGIEGVSYAANHRLAHTQQTNSKLRFHRGDRQPRKLQLHDLYNQYEEMEFGHSCTRET